MTAIPALVLSAPQLTHRAAGLATSAAGGGLSGLAVAGIWGGILGGLSAAVGTWALLRAQNRSFRQQREVERQNDVDRGARQMAEDLGREINIIKDANDRETRRLNDEISELRKERDRYLEYFMSHSGIRDVQ